MLPTSTYISKYIKLLQFFYNYKIKDITYVTYVKEKHELAQEAYTAWVQAGKPKFGTLFDNMKRNRAIFKLALRYCRNHIEEMKADACAESLLNKDARKFWDSVYKISNAKASAHVNSIGGVTGSVDVNSM